MSEEEKKYIKELKQEIKELRQIDGEGNHLFMPDDELIIMINLIEKQQAEIEQLKYSITKATEIIDEYANENEKDTKKLIEYQEKFL